MLASQVKQPEKAEEKKALSVSAALDIAKGSLEQLKLRVIGEVSEVNVKKGYANAYFTLKDETGTLPCQMWLDRYNKTGVKLEVGMLVEVVGRFSLYAKKGRMHFQAFGISLAGEGMLRQQVAQLERKLAAEGLMDASRKVPVPEFPMKIGVVTSPRGDAIHDVLRTTRRRFPLAHIYVAGVPVEGANAPQHMIEGMRACYRARVDVILLVRGGGSYEDLMPFNDEALARAIVKCPIPVVTGIGHEPDTTIADLVGDLRASTPTGAAEAVTVQSSQLLEQLASTAEWLKQRTQQSIRHAELGVERYATRPLFKDPHSLFANDLMSLDMNHERLTRALPAAIEREKTHLAAYASRLGARPAGFAKDAAKLSAYEARMKASASHIQKDRAKLDGFATRLKAAASGMEKYSSRLDGYATRMKATTSKIEKRGAGLDSYATRMKATTSRFEKSELRLASEGQRMHEVGVKLLDRPSHDLALRAGRLHDLSPLAVLSRGYAIARDEQGGIVKHVAALSKGDSIEVSVADGVIAATVDSVKTVERSQ